MGLFGKNREPVFLKEDSEAVKQLEQLVKLRGEAPVGIQERLDEEIRIVKAGIRGEETIDFELRNSHIPMVVLHDLYLTHGDLSAQIDYLIVTCKCIFVIECKNLIGNIEINRSGDFIRSFSGVKKEGIYSPITQNRRHLELIKQIHCGDTKNPLFRALLERSFKSTYRSVIVLSNPKAVLNVRYAPKDIRDQVIRVDHLVEYIQQVLHSSEVSFLREKELEEFAQRFLQLHQDNPVDYTAKYRRMVEQQRKDDSQIKSGSETLLCPQCGALMVRREARRGSNVGKFFYGCSNYPKCRCIINITE